MSSEKSVRQVLEELAVFTWRRLKASIEYHVSQGEETISDTVLLSMAAEKHSQIRIYKCPKRLEARIGLDWEWFIGSTGTGWMHFAVQAKKLTVHVDEHNHEETRYDSLQHKVLIDGNQVPQIALLEKYANAVQAMPLYCLYNYCAKQFPIEDYWRCCSTSIDEEQFGCTLAPLEAIDHALKTRGQRTFEAIHRSPAVMPWRCLCCEKHLLQKREPLGVLPWEEGESEHDALAVPDPSSYFQTVLQQTSSTITGGVVPSAMWVLDIKD